MKRQRDLEQRLRSLEMLAQAVSAMKSLSAHHFRATRAALEPARAYREGIDHLLESTGAWLPAGDGPCGLLVIGAELGFCAGYNSRVVAAAAERRAALGDGPTACVGRRAATMLARRGVRVDRSYRGPTSVRGITDALFHLTEDILTQYVDRRLSALEVVANRFEGVGASSPVVTRLLPIQSHPSAGAPVARYVRAERLAAVAVRELLYITIVQVQTDALASEHGARLAATQSAEHWLGERTDRLRRHLSAVRREASTQEVIEISAGARARARSRASSGTGGGVLSGVRSHTRRTDG